MNTYYTKEQMDALALVIGTKLKDNKVTSADSINNFITSLDQGLSGGLGDLGGTGDLGDLVFPAPSPNRSVTIREPIEYKSDSRPTNPFSYEIEINNMRYEGVRSLRDLSGTTFEGLLGIMFDETTEELTLTTTYNYDLSVILWPSPDQSQYTVEIVQGPGYLDSRTGSVVMNLNNNTGDVL